MLRIHQSLSAAQARSYYPEGLEHADYYGRGGQSPSAWFGRGAERLGLTGEVTKEGFFALLDNRTPDGRRLTARDRADRRPGWDLVFSPPKGVSALRSLTGDERITTALWESTRETLAEIEATAVKTRLRRGGQHGTAPTAGIVASLFLHDTTRPLADGRPDPHDHIHAYLHNAVWVPHERRFQAAEMFDLHLDRPYFEAAFEARLARKLSAAGYPIERQETGWDVAGLAGIAEKFSRRTAEIEATAERRGVTSADEKGRLGARTRRGKAEPQPPDQLRRYWDAKLTPGERQTVAELRDAAGGSPTENVRGVTAVQALAHAADHVFSRRATVSEAQLLTEALKFGMGEVTPEGVRANLDRLDLLPAEVDGRRMVTTRAVLGEEQAMLRFAHDGRGVCDPLGGYAPHEFRRTHLNTGQRRAVSALLGSFDRVQILRGLAGVGKSTAMGELREAVEATGRPVFAVAPTTAAATVLRGEGFQAETIALLLVSASLQQKLDHAVLLVDEAGLVGGRDMARLFSLAERHGARVILSGDSGQHRSPARGAALKLLEERGGLKPAGLTEILRQTGKLKDAVAALARGHSGDGFDRLDALGLVHEIGDAESRYRQLAGAYADTLRQGKEALAIAPTHREGAAVTAAIRAELKARGLITGDERHFLRLNSANLTEAERRDAVHYHAGDVVQFTQNARGGWRRGERATVLGRDDAGVRVRRSGGEETTLPLGLAERFQLYRSRELSLAAGDQLRFTVNATTAEGKRLDNGMMATVAGFTPAGDLALTNGWIVPKDHGHLAPGFVVTSVAAQGRTVKGRVFIAQAAESLPASSREQFYVSVSRARGGPESVAVFTDDKAALRQAVGRSDRLLSAVELVEPKPARPSPWAEMAERARRATYRAKVYARLGLDTLQHWHDRAVQGGMDLQRRVSYER